jgi:predicted enzyme related to lactoylglutathione lyase
MKFIGLSLITENVPALVAFYEKIFRVKPEGDATHSTFELDGLSLAIYSKQASIRDMKFSYPADANCGYTTLMFLVDDAENEYVKLQGKDIHFLTRPTEYPWGTRAFHFTDPDGNIIDFVERLKK